MDSQISSHSTVAATTPPIEQGLCVLLVEDDEADAYMVHRALWDHPAVGRVVHVRDGVEALATIQVGGLEPDIAFIDLRMPRMDGFELLVAFTDCGDLAFPMVVLTSSSAPDDAIRRRLRNAIRVLIKQETVAEMSAELGSSIDAVWARRARH
jgi:CheY-like chemotaxis protein